MEDRHLLLHRSRGWSQADGDRRAGERRSGLERRTGPERGDRRDPGRNRRRARDRIARGQLGPAS